MNTPLFEKHAGTRDASRVPSLPPFTYLAVTTAISSDLTRRTSMALGAGAPQAGQTVTLNVTVLSRIGWKRTLTERQISPPRNFAFTCAAGSGLLKKIGRASCRER